MHDENAKFADHLFPLRITNKRFSPGVAHRADPQNMIVKQLLEWAAKKRFARRSFRPPPESVLRRVVKRTPERVLKRRPQNQKPFRGSISNLQTAVHRFRHSRNCNAPAVINWDSAGEVAEWPNAAVC